MKITDIEAGSFYHDGKDGVREVLSIGPGDAGVARMEYRILAAKVTQEFSWEKQQMVSLIGTVSSCAVPSFSAWAKIKMTKEECDDLLLRMAARKVKLSPGEKAFMDDARSEAGGEITPGTMISFDHMEGRAVSGLEKKGLVLRHKGEVEVSKLGAAWFQGVDAPVLAENGGIGR